jgi:hypothetical protein
MPSLPPPPVPQRLREMFKEYPEHVVRLQEVLNHVTQTSSAGVTPFDRFVWVLESRLGTFASEAREELKIAEASGDYDVIEKAKSKAALMSSARHKRHWIGDEALGAYCEANKDGFK